MKLVHVAMIGYALAAVVQLSACGSKEEEAPKVAQPQVAPKPQAAPADPTAKMAHAVVMGKSGANIDLKYEVLNRPQPGTPTEIEIALIPGAVIDSMTVNVTGTSGVTIVNGDASFGKLGTGEVARHKFLVTSAQPDVAYLTVNATTYAVGISSTRSFAIPLIISSPPAEAPAPASAATAPAPAKK